MQVPPSLVEDQTVGQKCQYTLLGRMRLGLDIRLNGNRMRLAAVSLSAGNLLVRSLRAAQRLEGGAALRGVEGLVLLPARTRTSAAFLSGAIVLEAVLAGAAWSLRGVFPW